MRAKCSSCGTTITERNRCSVLESGDILCVACGADVIEMLGALEVAQHMVPLRAVHPDTIRTNQ